MSAAKATESSLVREPCPICRTTEAGPVRYSKWGYDIVRCPSCGTGRTVSAGVDPAAIYDEGYFQGARSDGYGDYRGSEPVLRREFRRALRDLRRHGVAGGRLLELGCAYGFFLEEAAEHFEVYGNDISAEAVRRCRDRGLEVSEGDLGRNQLLELGPLDAVVMLDVIEHLEDPAAKIEAVAEALRPGGALMLTTGDWSSLAARLSGRYWRLLTPPQHLFFFSRRGLYRLLEHAGFEVTSAARPWKVVPVSLALYQVSQRLRLPVSWPKRLNRLGLPVNLFDTLRLVARRA